MLVAVGKINSSRIPSHYHPPCTVLLLNLFMHETAILMAII